MKAAINSFRISKDIEQLKEDLLTEIKEKGYAHLNTLCTPRLYGELSKCMGEIIMVSDIEIKPNGRFAAFRSEKVLPHTDSADANIIGWYCVKQDNHTGASKITNIGNLEEHFSSHEIEFLMNYKASFLDDKDKTSSKIKGLSDSPLIYQHKESLKVNYAPWLDFTHKDQDFSRILNKFKSYIEDRIMNHTVSIRLKKNEIMFIDNGQVLHSREEISPCSERQLRRLWIKTK